MTGQGTFTVALGERQLFLDDGGIARMAQMTQTMHRPDKKGAVIRPPRDGTLCGSVQTRSAPVWDAREEVFKFWLHGEHPYWESVDGLHWGRPYAGQEERRRCQVETDSGPHGITLVVGDPTDSERPFKAALPNVGFAASPDASQWEMLDVPRISTSDEQNFSFDQRGYRFILTFKRRGPYGRSVWLSTSADFDNWSDPELIFHADDADQLLGREHIRARFADATLEPRYADEPTAYNVDVYNMGTFRYEGLYIGTPAMFHSVAPSEDGRNTVGFHLLQLVCSRDLKHWQRLGGRQPFIGPSPTGSGAYDLTQIIGPSAPIVRGDELWFYYTGLKYRDVFPPQVREDPDASAICLAVLRRDGFVSLDAGEEEGVLVTEPFQLAGERLCANVDAPQGELRVEVVDGSGEVLAASEALSGDFVRAELDWQGSSWGSLQGRMAALRFRVRRARFYAYWME